MFWFQAFGGLAKGYHDTKVLPPVIREVAQMIDGAYGTLIDREMPLSIPN